jgi:RNA polymerase sigma-70 factor (ECF subfamily)
MLMDPCGDSDQVDRLLAQAGAGDRLSYDLLFAAHRDQLEQMIARRIDARLRPRIDPGDVVQEAYLTAFCRLPDYVRRRPMPFHLWLWKTAYERLLNLRRDHVDAACRSVERERALPDQSSLLIAQGVFASDPTPSEQLAREEQARQIHEALAELAETDREVLLLRYVDGLSNEEVAPVLEIDAGTASKRHGRALLRLSRVLGRQGEHQ